MFNSEQNVNVTITCAVLVAKKHKKYMLSFENKDMHTK